MEVAANIGCKYVSTGGLIVAGSPVGTSQFELDHILSKIEEAKTTLNDIILMTSQIIIPLQLHANTHKPAPKLQPCFGILRKVIAQKLTFLARTVPASQEILDQYEKFDMYMTEAFFKMTGYHEYVDAMPVAFKEAYHCRTFLPLRLGGLGIPSLFNAAQVGYYSSLCLVGFRIYDAMKALKLDTDIDLVGRIRISDAPRQRNLVIQIPYFDKIVNDYNKLMHALKFGLYGPNMIANETAPFAVPSVPSPMELFQIPQNISMSEDIPRTGHQKLQHNITLYLHMVRHHHVLSFYQSIRDKDPGFAISFLNATEAGGNKSAFNISFVYDNYKISDRQFVVYAALYMHLPIMDTRGALIPEFICPLCSSNTKVNNYGDHIFNCKSTNKQSIHNSVRDIIYDSCKSTRARSNGIHCQTEVSIPNLEAQYGIHPNRERLQAANEANNPRIDGVVRFTEGKSAAFDVRITYPNNPMDATDALHSGNNAAGEKTDLWCNPRGRLKVDVGINFFPIVLVLPFGAQPKVTQKFFNTLAKYVCPSVTYNDGEGSRRTIDLNNRRLKFTRNLLTKITLELIKSATYKIDSYLNNPAVVNAMLQAKRAQCNINFTTEIDRLMTKFTHYQGVHDHLAPHISCQLTRLSSCEINAGSRLDSIDHEQTHSNDNLNHVVYARSNNNGSQASEYTNTPAVLARSQTDFARNRNSQDPQDRRLMSLARNHRVTTSSSLTGQQHSCSSDNRHAQSNTPSGQANRTSNDSATTSGANNVTSSQPNDCTSTTELMSNSHSVGNSARRNCSSDFHSRNLRTFTSMDSQQSCSSDNRHAQSNTSSGQANRRNKNVTNENNEENALRLHHLKVLMDEPCPLDDADPSSLNFTQDDLSHICWGPDKDKGCPARFDTMRRRAYYHNISNADLVALGYLHTAAPRCTCVADLRKKRNAKKSQQTLSRSASPDAPNPEQIISLSQVSTTQTYLMIDTPQITTRNRSISVGSRATVIPEPMNQMRACLSNRSNSVQVSHDNLMDSISLSDTDDSRVPNSLR